MTRLCPAVGLFLALGACASASPMSLLGGRVRGDANQVLVKGFGTALEATPFAVAHCSRFRRSAQFDGRTADGLRFQCRSN